MAIKLIKASKILRTGMYDLVAYCKRTGIPIKEDPNFRIEDQDYLKISKELNPYIASLIESKRTSAQKFTLSNSAQHRSSAKEKVKSLGLKKMLHYWVILLMRSIV